MLSSQRGSDELFSTCVSNGPFIMSSSASAGEVDAGGALLSPSRSACAQGSLARERDG